MCLYVYLCLCMCLYVCLCLCMCVFVCLCLFVFVCDCMVVCVFVFFHYYVLLLTVCDTDLVSISVIFILS